MPHFLPQGAFLSPTTRLNILLAIFLLPATLIFAQPVVKWGVNMGINMGAPIPSKVGKDAKGSLGIAPRGGLDVFIPITKNWQLKTGVAFSQKNAQFSDSLNLIVLDTTYFSVGGQQQTLIVETLFRGIAEGFFKNSYLEIPLAARYQRGRLGIDVGGFGAVLLKGKNEVTANGVVGFAEPPVYDNRVIDNSDALRPFDGGVLLGIDYRLWKQLVVHSHTNFSLVHIYKQPIQGVEGTIRNFYFNLGLGWRF